MASITFRLRSSSHVGAIDMDGKVITVREVQSAVAQKLKAPEEEIRVFMANSTDLLHPDEELLAYSVVDVVRQAHTGKLTYAAPRIRPNAMVDAATTATATALASGPVGGGMHLSEEERLAQLQAEVTLDTGIDQVRNSRFRRGGGPGGRGGGFGGMGGGGGGGGGGRGGGGGGMGGGGGGGRGGGGGDGGGGSGGGYNMMDADSFKPPPKGYVCHNCGKSGHYIQHCPAVKANGGKHLRVLSLPVGIPESMLEECSMDDPAPKFITRDHRLVKRKMDSAAFANIMLPTMAGMESPPLPQSGTGAETGKTSADGNAMGGDGANGGEDSAKQNGDADDTNTAIPEKLLCLVDKVPAREAMKSPCCERLICKTCFDALVAKAMKSMDDMDADPPECPACAEPLMIDEFTPAEEERQEIDEFLSSRKRARA